MSSTLTFEFRGSYDPTSREFAPRKKIWQVRTRLWANPHGNSGHRDLVAAVPCLILRSLSDSASAKAPEDERALREERFPERRAPRYGYYRASRSAMSTPRDCSGGPIGWGTEPEEPEGSGLLILMGLSNNP